MRYLTLLALLVACDSAVAPERPSLLPAVYHAIPSPGIAEGVLVLWDDSTYTDAMRAIGDTAWTVLRGTISIQGDTLITFTPAPSYSLDVYESRLWPESLSVDVLGVVRRFQRQP